VSNVLITGHFRDESLQSVTGTAWYWQPHQSNPETIHCTENKNNQSK